MELSGTLLLTSNHTFWPQLCSTEKAFLLRSPPWNITPRSLPLIINVDLYNMCGAQIIYGPGPSTRGESRGLSRGGLWPKSDKIKHEKSLGYIQGQFGPQQNFKSHRREGQKRYRNKFERENLKYLGKATLTAIQCSAPDRAAFFGFYNHPQRLWVWIDGTSINLGRFNPTRGRRTVDTG